MDIFNAIWSEFSDSVIRSLSSNAEYQTLQTEHTTASDEFFECLNAAEKKQILDLESRRNLLFALEEDAVFAHGFRLGARFMPDILHTERMC